MLLVETQVEVDSELLNINAQNMTVGFFIENLFENLSWNHHVLFSNEKF